MQADSYIRFSRKSTHPFFSISFLFALGILILNDAWLKSTFPGWITGKLSDFAGLYIFAIFFAVVFPFAKKHVFIFTAIFFLFWKLPLSRDFVSFFSDNVFPISRIEDITDAIALIVLLPAWKMMRNHTHVEIRWKLVPVAALCLFSFVATSIARPDLPTFYFFVLPAGGEEALKVFREEFPQFQNEEIIPDSLFFKGAGLNVKINSESSFTGFIRMDTFQGNTMVFLLGRGSRYYSDGTVTKGREFQEKMSARLTVRPDWKDTCLDIVHHCNCRDATGVPIGTWIFPVGEWTVEATFQNGQADGLFRILSHGAIFADGKFANGKPHGRWKVPDLYGYTKRKEKFMYYIEFEDGNITSYTREKQKNRWEFPLD